MINIDLDILNVCNNEYKYFLKKANVKGVGLAYKVINGCTTNIKCICVMVSKKVCKNLLLSNDLIPLKYKGMPTDVIQTGKFKTLSFTDRIRPVIGGYSIGVSGIYNGGSYGCLVKDANGLYVLSNNHVIAVENLVPIGNPILQPAPDHGGTSPNDVIAFLSRYIPMLPTTPSSMPENFVDCAIAKVMDASLVSPYIVCIGIPRGTIAPVLGMYVQTASSSSGFFIAPIKAIGVTLEVETVLDNVYLYKNQILVDYIGREGDSGAIALTQNREVVGLLFSGSDTELMFNPIDAVLQSLNVSLVTS